MASQETAYASKGCDAELASVTATALSVSGVATFAGGTANTSVRTALVALVGGAQAGTALSTQWSRFITVASAGDSAQLPAATVGLSRVVKNAAAANSMNIFPATGEVINAAAANAAFALAAGKSVEFRCFVAGTWDALLGA